LTVAAASDLSPLEPELRQLFPSADLTFTFASSGTLARQIENGAPYDVFLSASEDFLLQLTKRNKVDKDSVQVFALGRLGLYSKSGAVRTLQDLKQPGVKVIAIANPQLAPYGAAAVAALKQAKLYDELQPNLVFAENIRQALQFVETGNAQVGLLSWSLIYDKGGYLIPSDLHPAIRQVAAPIRQKGKNTKLAEAFIEALTSTAGRTLLATHGFNLMPPPPRLRH
jgi:molybdate transport system substrate-binding protein